MYEWIQPKVMELNMMKREACMHPKTAVMIYDYWFDPKGMCIVMEYAPGKTLWAKVRRAVRLHFYAWYIYETKWKERGGVSEDLKLVGWKIWTVT